ncbi:phosphoribosyltransferase [Terrabacter sp. 2YAF2]|uniref:phosphoribosyltransferase n=1 Tax=Terrabacter sp. 2YAF2 TaxID=3233026 RepID=UPI003F972EF1
MTIAHHADASTLADKEVLTWEGFGAAIRELATLVADSSFRPDVLVAVARGGLIPGGGLSYALGIKLTDAINVEFYTDVEETLPDPVLLAPHLDTESLKGRQVLVVDDVADSGRTLALVLDLIQEHGAEARSAVLYGKPRSIVTPDYVWRQTDRWIVFPWSAEPPVSGSQVTAAPRAD